ncbi:MAG: glycosyltransferase [Chitinophagales bacterium]
MLEYIYILLHVSLFVFLVLPFVNVLIAQFRKQENIPEIIPVDKMEEVHESVNQKMAVAANRPSEEEAIVSIQRDFACIITAYKNADIAMPLVESLLVQNYEQPEEKQPFIYLVADECDISNLLEKTQHWDKERVMILKPESPLRLKAKSIIHAMENFKREHDTTVVFDADNLAHPNFLKELNRYFHAGFEAVQGQRTAKNLDTVYACADSTGEIYKNYIERYVPYLLGSSAVISGSGMAVETALYWDYLNSKEIQEGKKQWKKMLQEDKILQNHLLKKDVRIAYAKNAIVYDEKVTTAEQVETQRTRWLYSYFQNMPNSLNILGRGIRNMSFNQILFGMITITPPLFILVFFAAFVGLLDVLIDPFWTFVLYSGLGIFGMNVLWVLHLSKAPKAVWNKLWGLPLFVLKQVTALFKMRNPNKNFKHTEHNRTYNIKEVMSEVGES